MIDEPKGTQRSFILPVTFAAIIALSFSLVFICFINNISSNSITKFNVIEELNNAENDDSASHFYPYYRALFGKRVSLTGKGGLPDDATINIKFFDEVFFSTWTSWYSYSTYSIGTFQEVDKNNSLVISNGSYCSEGNMPRHGLVQVVNGPKLAITQFANPSPCYYEIMVTSPHIGSSSIPAAATGGATEPSLSSFKVSKAEKHANNNDVQ